MTDFFISYSHQDAADYSDQLSRSLSEAGFKVFLDREQLKMGDDLPRRISDALKRARYFVALVSPAYSESAWARRELEAAAAADLRILPIRLQEANMPDALQNRVYVDAGDSVEAATQLLLKTAWADIGRVKKRRLRVVSEYLPVAASILGAAAALTSGLQSVDFEPIATSLAVVAGFIAVLTVVVLGTSRLRMRPKPVDALKEEVRDAYIRALEASRMNPFNLKERRDEQ